MAHAGSPRTGLDPGALEMNTRDTQDRCGNVHVDSRFTESIIAMNEVDAVRDRQCLSKQRAKAVSFTAYSNSKAKRTREKSLKKNVKVQKKKAREKSVEKKAPSPLIQTQVDTHHPKRGAMADTTASSTLSTPHTSALTTSISKPPPTPPCPPTKPPTPPPPSWGGAPSSLIAGVN